MSKRWSLLFSVVVVCFIIATVLSEGFDTHLSAARAMDAPTVTEFSSTIKPLRMALGSDGDVWFTNNNSPHLGRITVSGEFSEIALPHPGLDIVRGQDGNMWVCEGNVNKIARI